MRAGAGYRNLLSWVVPLTALAIGLSTAGQAQGLGESPLEFLMNEQRGHSGFGRRNRLPEYDPPYHAYRYEPRRGHEWERRYFHDMDRYPTEHRRGSIGVPPQVRVASPEYYTYTPDTLTTVRFDELCELEVASQAAPTAAAATGLFSEACATAPSLRLRMLPQVGAAIRKHYAEHPRFLWLEEGTASAKAQAALSVLAKSEEVGLSPADYRVDFPRQTEGAIAAQRGDLLRFELTLSAKVLTYVLDATRGRIDPNRISGYHDLPRKKVDLAKALDEIAKTRDIGRFLEQSHPASPQFRALVTALADLRARAPKQPVAVADDTFIKPGEASPDLGDVIAAIQATGSAALLKTHAEALRDGIEARTYDRELVALVRDFQRENGLKADGIVGKNTIRAMRRDRTATRIRKLQLALERLRWLPREFGDRYLLLNQPAFEVTYVDRDRDPLSMRVIIGKKSSQTYVFADKVEAVEYNPYWGVPRSIIVNEMLPKLYRDPSYLDRMGYEVTTQSGRQVASRSVDWELVAYDRLSVNVRQPPGSGNALGRLKIEFPNKHAIYMHDTPDRHLFSKRSRMFSHGCVRLEHPREMAAALLGKSTDHIGSRIDTGRNATERVSAHIPVYLAYFTAWPDAAGDVRYYDDVYDRDEYLSQALTKTAEARAGS
jgi:murein L,D-transpeptidase YcbB/YkuD